MVAELCSDMANAVYEELAKDNTWYAHHKNRVAWTNQHLADNGMMYVKEARRCLAMQLTDENVSKADKDKIHDALTKDAAIRGPHDDRVKPLTIN